MTKRVRDRTGASTAEMLALRGRFDPESKTFKQDNGDPGLTNNEIAERLGLSRAWVWRCLGPQPTAPANKQLEFARGRLAKLLADCADASRAFVELATDAKLMNSDEFGDGSLASNAVIVDTLVKQACDRVGATA